MSRTLFSTLVGKLRGALLRDQTMGSLRNGTVEPEVRLVIVLRITAGASDLDLMALWGVARQTIYYIYHETTDVILRTFPLAGFPASEAVCHSLSKGFRCSRKFPNPLPGCIGALDGIAIPITKPRTTDCGNPSTYFHRKGYFALPVQAICDSRYRFTFCSAKCAGPTHDSVAFSVSSYAARLASEGLPRGYWIAADDAYICTESVITPVQGSDAAPGSAADAFNYYQSSHRMHIEQAFGYMIARWGILKRPLRFALAENVRIVQLSMVLNNFCIDNADESPEYLLSENEYSELLQYSNGLLQSEQNSRAHNGLPGRRNGRMQSDMRTTLLKIVEEGGFRRP